MSKSFQRGLIVGKFCPLHKGHEYLIAQASEACADLLLISYTKPEFPLCGPLERERWLALSFPHIQRLVIDDAILQRLCIERGIADIPEIPHNDAAEEMHRQFVGWLCLVLLETTVDAVFTSEDYGDGFAAVLTQCFQQHDPGLPVVTHIKLDQQRITVPVSGTRVRLDPHANRAFLSAHVYASFVKKICLLGAESSGKTTLAAALAQHLQTLWVPEYGRELWVAKEGKLQFEDMEAIAVRQLASEDHLGPQADQWLVCDTSPLTTLLYSLAMFQRAADALQQMANTQYDCIILCDIDIPLIQDGTRQDHAFRLHQQAWYVQQLRQRALPYLLVRGNVEERLSQVMGYLAGK
ncbi:AAA family ATPase [Undibacterium sp. Di27W]|uniref:AAA family ATPase n=1 Tax=Undibacterium sp. Di27W TaxID=3413036 RepID=UPI003BF04EBB